MKIYTIFLILICVSLVFPLKAQLTDCNYNDSLKLRIELVQSSTKVFSVFDYKIIFENNSSTKQTVLQPWNSKYYFPLLQIRKNGEKWKTIRGTEKSTNIMHAHSDDILVITSIPPDSSVSIKTEWIAGVNCKEYASAGWYELRLVSDLIYCKNRQRIYSEPVKLHIEDYNDEVNKLAQDWLVNALPHPGVIYSQKVEKLEMGLIYQKYVFKRYNLNLEEKLSEFISKFPTSDFTPWAKLYLVQWKCRFTTIDGKIIELHSLSDRKRYPSINKALKLVKEIEEDKTLINDEEFQKVFKLLNKKVKRKYQSLRRRLGW